MNWCRIYCSFFRRERRLSSERAVNSGLVGFDDWRDEEMPISPHEENREGALTYATGQTAQVRDVSRAGHDDGADPYACDCDASTVGRNGLRQADLRGLRPQRIDQLPTQRSGHLRFDAVRRRPLIPGQMERSKDPVD